ncbi:MAG: DUF882 domain-containing protein [Pseudomonadota bacterium]
MLRKLLVVRIIVLSVFMQSCGSWLVPAVRAVHAKIHGLPLETLEPEDPGQAEETSAPTEGSVRDPAPAVAAAKPGGKGQTAAERPDIEPAAVTKHQAAGIGLEARAGAGNEKHDGPQGTVIEVDEDGVMLSLSEAGVAEEGELEEMILVSSAIETKSEILMQEPGGVEETAVKGDSLETQAANKLLARAGISKPKHVTIVRPYDSLDELVLLWNPNTREALFVDAVDGNRKTPGPVLTAMKHFLRFKKDNVEHDVDPKLARLLYEMAETFESILFVTSGYRAAGGSTKETSFHTCGKAADIRHPRVSGRDLRDFAVAWGAGGVGYYPKTNSVHVDVREKPYYWVHLPKKGDIADMEGYWAKEY